MKIMRVNLFFLMLIGLTLGMTTLAKAGGGHHHHHYHYDHYYDDYVITYSQPHNYYGRPYYPQPQLSYYPAPVPVPVPAPVPVYAPVVAYPPNVILGIDTGNTSFMLSYYKIKLRKFNRVSIDWKC